MKDFRQLKVWEKAHHLTLEIYRATASWHGSAPSRADRPANWSITCCWPEISDGGSHHWLDVSHAREVAWSMRRRLSTLSKTSTHWRQRGGGRTVPTY